MKRVFLFTFPLFFLLLFAQGQIIRGPIPTTDSLRVKPLKRSRLNAIIGSGLNNTFMGYPRVNRYNDSRGGAQGGGGGNVQTFKNNTTISLLPIAEAGFNVRIKTKHPGLNHNFYVLAQLYQSQYHFSYEGYSFLISGESSETFKEMDYVNQTANLKTGYGFEFNLEYFYITPQLFYSVELLRKSTVTGYTDSSNYIESGSNPKTLVSNFHSEEYNKQYQTISSYKYFVFSIEIGKNFNHRISRAYIRSGIGAPYIEKIYSIGVNIRLY